MRALLVQTTENSSLEGTATQILSDTLLIVFFGQICVLYMYNYHIILYSIDYKMITYVNKNILQFFC